MKDGLATLHHVMNGLNNEVWNNDVLTDSRMVVNPVDAFWYNQCPSPNKCAINSQADGNLAVCSYGSDSEITLNDQTELNGITWEVIKLFEQVDASFPTSERYRGYTPR